MVREATYTQNERDKDGMGMLMTGYRRLGHWIDVGEGWPTRGAAAVDGEDVGPGENHEHGEDAEGGRAYEAIGEDEEYWERKPKTIYLVPIKQHEKNVANNENVFESARRSEEMRENRRRLRRRRWLKRRRVGKTWTARRRKRL